MYPGNLLRRAYEGCFFGPRVNCERAPILPATILRWVLDDPRKIPYLLIWYEPSSTTVQEAVRIARYSEPDGYDWTGWVDVKRTTGDLSLLPTIERPLPRDGGRSNFVICPVCDNPRRALFGWQLNRRRIHAAFVAPWQCRTCAGLRYASEGAARLRIGLVQDWEDSWPPWMASRDNPRPEPWYPWVFANPADAEAILARHS
jgi:hypothetical protein